LTGLRQAGALGKVKVVAYDAASAEVSALKNGGIQALIAQDPKQEGEVAMESADKLVKGQTLDKTTLTEIVTIKSGDGDRRQVRIQGRLRLSARREAAARAARLIFAGKTARDSAHIA
jgi:ABC-type sugar transport system substrate-binding protein